MYVYTAQYSTNSWQFNSHTANHAHVCGTCQVITHKSNWLLKWKKSLTSITALLLPDNYSSTFFSYSSNCYCAPQQHFHQHVRRRRSNLNRIDKDAVLRCKDWWPHWGNKTNRFILAPCRRQAGEKSAQINRCRCSKATDLKSGQKEVAHLSIWLQFDGLTGLQTQVIGCWCELLLYALLQTVHQLTENRSVWQLPELYEILSEWLWNERWLGKEDYIHCCTVKVKLGQEIWK